MAFQLAVHDVAKATVGGPGHVSGPGPAEWPQPMTVGGCGPPVASAPAPVGPAAPARRAAAPNCIICLQGIGAQVSFLPCAHGPFHRQCLSRTLTATGGRCPVCRLNIGGGDGAGGPGRTVQGYHLISCDMVFYLSIPFALCLSLSLSLSLTLLLSLYVNMNICFNQQQNC